MPDTAGEKLNNNPTKKHKSKINKLLNVINADRHNKKLPKIIGDYKPGFQLIGLVSRVLANGPGDLGSILDRVIPKTLKIVLDTSLLNSQQYKVCINGKVGAIQRKE